MNEEKTQSPRNLKLILQLVDNDNDSTLLEGYLKNELDILISNRNDTISWKDAKEQLGTKLVTKDLELSSYKSKYYISTALNIGIICGLVAYRIINRRT